jgi:enterochelin esterase family protein
MHIQYQCEFESATLVLHKHKSTLLENNPLGDSVLRYSPILIPKENPGNLPLVALLVGFTGSGLKVISQSLWKKNLPERIAQLLAQKKIPPAIFVWPACETSLGGSQYVNSSATGDYEDFLVQELLPCIEDEYHCGGENGRIVVGKSSGGFGALHLAMNNPGYFHALGSHSGDLNFQMTYVAEFSDALTAWQKAGGPKAFLDSFPPKRLGRQAHAAINMLAMSACYSPNEKTELGFDLPLEPDTGGFRADVFDRWLRFDPLHKIKESPSVDALKSLKACFLDAGNEDEFGLQWGLRLFRQELEAAKVEHHIEFYAGGHFDTDWRYEHSLPYLLESLNK